MRFATAIKLSGSLVPAEECNYNSFSDLCLICPHCRNSVYLVGEHERSSTTRQLPSGRIIPVKESKVSSHFTHHIRDENFTICEKKDSDITPQVLIHRATVARLQRSRIFKASFWQLFCQNQYLEKPMRELKQDEFNKYIAEAEIHTHIAFYSPLMNERISIEMAQKDKGIEKAEKEPLFRDRSIFHCIRPIAQYVWKESGRDGGFDHQYLFVQEALLFLYAPSNKKLLRKCLTALVMGLYSIHFFNVTSDFPDAFGSGKLDPTIRSQIIEKTETISNSFLLEDRVMTFNNSESLCNISTLSITLIVALLSIDLEVEFKKHGQ